KARLAAFGVEVPEGEVCATREAALAAAARLAPVAMKAVGADIAHKTEIGAVRLGLVSPQDVANAYDELSRISARVLVERMAPAPVAELIVGAARDPALGLHLIIGAGGVLAELLADRRILMLPASAVDIRAALGELRVHRLLSGWRGKPAADIDAVVAAIAAIAIFVAAHAASLDELDVNPLIVTPDRAIAVDVLLRLRET
ncbi:MAG: acetate--CoA ligase family protein, partial [Pseudomonadota bacterium]|nr:acetate--CoA ligase family protein [Pseudomonadota bacterium]